MPKTVRRLSNRADAFGVHRRDGYWPSSGLNFIVVACAGLAAQLGCTPTTCERLRAEEQAKVAEFDRFVEDENVTQEMIDALTLDEIPVELDIVLNDMESFTITAEHPLGSTLPGTPVDSDQSSVDYLNGCWGRIETERRFNDAATDIVVAEALWVDLREEGAQTFYSFRLTGLTRTPCVEDDRPLVQYSYSQVTGIADGTLNLEKVSVQAAGIDDDGGLSLHKAGAADAARNDQINWSFSFTVDGDHLVTTESQYDPANPDVNDLDFWVRFDCACALLRAEERVRIEEFDRFVEEENVTQELIDALTLDEVPVELDIVRADPETFTIDSSHPLWIVTPGTPVNSEQSTREYLQGCWGRIETERRFNRAATDVVVADALRIDLGEQGAETVYAFRLTGLTGVPCVQDDRPLVQSSFSEVTGITDGAVELEKRNVQAAGVNDDGSLSLHKAGAADAVRSDEIEWSFSYTVDGDYLVTTEPDYDPANPDVNDLDFWVRFDCVR